jgi:hypothetical protein
MINAEETASGKGQLKFGRVHPLIVAQWHFAKPNG